MFLRIIRYDLRSLARFLAKSSIPLIFVYALINIPGITNIINLRQTYPDLVFSAGDVMLRLFVGSPDFMPYADWPWVLFFMITLYTLLYYPSADLKGAGRQILLASKSRTLWWLSKCLWVVLGSIMVFSILPVFQWILALLINLEPSMQYRSFHLLSLQNLAYEQTRLNIILLIMPCAVLAVTALLQMLLSFIVKPVYAYLTSVIWIFLSLPIRTPLFIGNYALLMRYTPYFKDGVSLISGGIILATLFVLVIGVGLYYFNHLDIWSQKNQTTDSY